MTNAWNCVHQSKIKKLKGLTLLELILAVTVMSVIILGGSALSLTAIRLTNLVTREMQLQNELQYVLRDIEVHIRGGRDPNTAVPQCPTDCLQIKRDSPKGTITVDYLYDAASQQMSRHVTEPSGLMSKEILSSGVLVRRNDPNTPAPIPMFAVADPVVEVRISAQETKYGKVIRLGDVTKSILLRGGSTP